MFGSNGRHMSLSSNVFLRVTVRTSKRILLFIAVKESI